MIPNEAKNLTCMQFHLLHRARMKALQSELNARGLSDVGSPMILFILESSGTGGEVASQLDLARKLNVSPATIATSLKSLERQGYVEKKLDEHDNRRNRIAISEKGLAVVEQFHIVFDEIDERTLGGLSPQERAEFVKLIRKMLTNLGVEEDCIEGGCCPC